MSCRQQQAPPQRDAAKMSPLISIGPEPVLAVHVWGPISRIFTSTYCRSPRRLLPLRQDPLCYVCHLNSDPSDPDIIIKLDISIDFNVMCHQLTLDVLGGQTSSDYTCRLKEGDNIDTWWLMPSLQHITCSLTIPPLCTSVPCSLPRLLWLMATLALGFPSALMLLCSTLYRISVRPLWRRGQAQQHPRWLHPLPAHLLLPSDLAAIHQWARAAREPKRAPAACRPQDHIGTAEEGHPGP